MWSACRPVVIAVFVGLFFLSAPVLAQETGGSFGGSDFSSGSSGSSGGGSSDWSSSGGSSDWSSSGGSSDWPSSGSSWGDMGYFALSMLLIVGMAFALLRIVVGMGYWIRSQGRASRSQAPASAADMHASTLQLGIDWYARAELQQALARMAASGSTRSSEGRADLLSETELALRRAELSWVYVGYHNLGWHTPSEAQAQFKAAAKQARVEFRRELVRNVDGNVMTAAPPPLTARPDEGPGFVVVTLVLVARRELAAVVPGDGASSIRAALEDRGTLGADQLVAIEVIWSPAVEQDRMSSAELEQHYPHLQLIDPTTIAGRLFCQFCGGAFAMELLECPHCGAAVTRDAVHLSPSTPA